MHNIFHTKAKGFNMTALRRTRCYISNIHNHDMLQTEIVQKCFTQLVPYIQLKEANLLRVKKMKI